jgi:phospholipid-binding lipoprotein MlaA
MMKFCFTLCFLMVTGLVVPSAFSAQQGPSKASPGVSQPTPAAEDYSNLFENLGQEQKKLQVPDPLEPFNRGVFWVNDKLYFYLFKPVARAYRVVPEPARVSVSNFFSNVATPVRFVNALLQLKFLDAEGELARFLINSTIGVGGLFDPANNIGGLGKKEEDLGQTFGHYGAGPGIYLVLPILGPSDLRDGIGLVGDHFLDPWTYLATRTENLAAKGVYMETRISLAKDTYDQITKESLDPYLFIKNAYIQNRQSEIAK